MAEHGFTEKHPPESHAVEAADQLARLIQHLDGMLSDLRQLLQALDDPRVESLILALSSMPPVPIRKARSVARRLAKVCLRRGRALGAPARPAARQSARTRRRNGAAPFPVGGRGWPG